MSGHNKVKSADLEAALGVIKPGNQVEASSPFTVYFEDVNYTVKEKKKDKPILTGVSGVFEPGTMTALMGPSGSGKTTLLDVIAGRKNSGKLTGQVTYNGQPATSSVLKQSVGYVEQFDTLVPELTVEQMLTYAAELKLPQALGGAAKRERVERAMQQLALEECQDTVIGDALNRGISGGQAKRVNIGLALITSPSVLFLDEPTTGLDSHMANEVVAILRRLAVEGGRTICATIHSPTSYAFNLFDSLLMLKQGQVIYDGPLEGDAQHARSYFSTSFGFAPPSPESGIFFSSVEWLVQITSETAAGTSVSSVSASGSSGGGSAEKLTVEQYTSGKVVKKGGAGDLDFASVYSASDLARANQEKRAQVLAARGLDANSSTSTSTSIGGSNREVATSTMHGILTLLRYRTLTHIKSPDFLGPRFGDKVMFSVLILSLYWKIGEQTDAQSIQSTASLLYFIIALCGYGAAAFVPSLTLDRPLFYRERADGYYSTFTYYVAKFIEEAVVAAATSLLFSAIVFYSCGLQGSFGVFLGVYFLTSMIGIVLAYAVAAAVPSMEAANALLPTYVTFCMYFGGLFLIFDKIPRGWKWYSYTDFLRYAWTALMVNQFGGSSTGTGAGSGSGAGAGAGMVGANANATAVVDTAVFGGKDVLAFYSISTDGGVMDDVWFCCTMLVVLMLVFAGLGGLALAKINHSTR